MLKNSVSFIQPKSRDKIFTFLLAWVIILLVSQDSFCQTDESGHYQVIIESIGSLESSKDPKCHATASRLEDFIYGTPLTEKARERRIEIQKDVVRYIWETASTAEGVVNITENKLNQASDQLIKFMVYKDEWYLILTDGNKVHISQRDYKHYSSIAYGLRAVLAVQQDDLFGDGILLPLTDLAVNRLKFVCDITSIGLLKIADQRARQEDRYEIKINDLDHAWALVGHQSVDKEKATNNNSRPVDYEMTLSVIRQKLQSYEDYNQLSQKVFLRNVQVFFAQVPWPSDTSMAAALTYSFQESVLEFASKQLLDAQNRALTANNHIIRHEDVRMAMQRLLPHTINQFEDVTFFDRLPRSRQIRIEAYDLDAFRDSGIHWNYLEEAIRRSADEIVLEPDPHALELLVEGIAQMGVLLWRMAGQEAKKNNEEVLNAEHINAAFRYMKTSSNDHNTTVIDPDQEQRAAKKSLARIWDTSDKELFVDVTRDAGIDFEHRTSDWLNRQIRSYLFKSDENLARLSIPPAFGGSGVGAEDLNRDGFTDLLLLGGQGVKIYLGKKGKSFEDITERSGVIWTREDGTYGEPRQPILSDFDNDGIRDLFISYANDDHKMYKGNGDGTFEDLTSEVQLGGEGLIGGPCTALDYDKDGLLDLYIGYFGNYLKGDLPTLKRHNDNGSPNQMFRNLGNFQFQNVTEKSGLGNTGWTQAVGHADINNDGWQDVIVGNDFGVNSYYINNQDGTFTDKSVELGVDKPSYTMNIGFTDLNADDYPDFYISNIVVMEKDDKYTAPTAETTMHFNPEVLGNMRVVEANDLFVSKKEDDKLAYDLSKSIGRGYSSTGWAWDADFFDYDNDGDDDLYCLNGMNQYSVYGKQNPYYSSPDGQDMEVEFAQSKSAVNVFFENEGGFLENRSEGSGLDLNSTSRSAAYLDYDNDGDLDVIVNNYNGPAFFYENRSESLNNNWISLDLKISDEDEQVSLVGTKIKISTPDGIKLWRQISSTTGYLSVHPGRVHGGLGTSRKCKIEVQWPDGLKTNHKISKVNRNVVVEKRGNKASIAND